MTDKSLIAFKTVAECGNKAKAAQLLNVSTTTIWRIIIDLEEEFNIPLFIKGKDPLVLTIHGVFLKNLLDNGLNTTQRFNRFIEMNKNHQVSIGIAFPSGWHSIDRYIAELMIKDPSVIIHPQYGDSRQVRDLLMNKEIEFAVLPDRINCLDYRIIKVIEGYEWGIAAPSGIPLTNRLYVENKDIEGIPLIFPTDRSCLSSISEWLGYEIALERQNTYNDTNTLSGMIKSGFGLAFVPSAEKPGLKEKNLSYYSCLPKIFSSIYIYAKCDSMVTEAGRLLEKIIEQ
ncbi:MAG: LysR family transcriptional regulator [Saccharofermentans sp.]|nr:LysR family transcriptional regulator [Saccharofermentans sp.]